MKQGNMSEAAKKVSDESKKKDGDVKTSQMGTQGGDNSLDVDSVSLSEVMSVDQDKEEIGASQGDEEESVNLDANIKRGLTKMLKTQPITPKNLKIKKNKKQKHADESTDEEIRNARRQKQLYEEVKNKADEELQLW